jgi:hypothetical protein
MRLSEWARANRSGFLITACVVVVIVGRWAYNDMEKTQRWKMADELAAATIFWGLPAANPDNTEYVYGQRSKAGLAVYWQNAAGNKSLIWERKEGDFNPSIFSVQDWSPDGKYFAFACDGHARIRASNDGRQVADINVGGGLFNFVWLSPSSIAAFTWRDLFLLNQGQVGWTKIKLFSVTNASSVNTLIRLSSDSVAWRQDDDVWTFNLRTRTPSKISDATTNPVLGLFFSEAGRSLLMNCGTNGGDLFRCFPEEPDRPWVHLGKIGNPDDFIYKVYEIDGGRGYAYLSSNQHDRDSRPAVENKNFTLLVKKTIQDAPVTILGKREIEDCELNGDHLYILGTQTNEPPGLWDYNVKSETLRCLFSGLSSTKYSKFSTPEYKTTTNALGESVSYYIWPPTHMVSGKKYPLVVTQTTYRWMLEAEIAVNSGYYFALAERPSWFSQRINSWGEDVKSVCADLAKNGSIDTNQIFLSSVSTMEGGPLKELMAKYPEFSKGAFLQGGIGPTSMNGDSADIVMLIGDKDDSLKLADLKTYQEAAVRNGIAVKVVLRKGPHSTITQDNQIQLGRQYADFLYSNE